MAEIATRMPIALRPLDVACCLWAAMSPFAPGFASEHGVVSSAGSEQAWNRAVTQRAQLELSPAGQRTRDQYEAVLNAFRSIYHQNPTASKAPAAVAAVADLLAEKGRQFADARLLRAAIGQYEFLRQQYPASPQVENALLLEAEICRQDLKDASCAAEKLRAVVDSQPGTSFAEQAALELKDFATKAAAKPKVAAKPAENTAPELAPTAPNVALADGAVRTQTASPATGRVVRITGMRHWSNPTSTRIAIDLGGKVEYEAARVPRPDRIFFDLHGARLAPGLNGHQVEVVDDGYLKRIRTAQFRQDVTRVVLDVSDVSEYSAFLLPDPWRLIIDVHGSKTAAASGAGPKPEKADNSLGDVAGLSRDAGRVAATARPTSEPVSARVATQDAQPETVTTAVGAETSTAAASTRAARKGWTGPAGNLAESQTAVMPHAADPDSDGQRSLVRALGLKVGRIVIDPGHGGHDSGTLGPGGIEEKDVVLDVALRLGRLLHQRLGAEIVYTRDDDTFIPLETRTAIANKAQADLFLSIHGNSSPEASARGVEAYYLNFTSDPNALEVAARENALSRGSVHQLSDLVRKITLKDKIDESREFAADVDGGLFAGLKAGNPGLKDRGVKKAPFVVLIGAQMPSVLAEISFLTNPEDADELRQASYRERIAESLDAGVERYLRGLSGAAPALKNAGKRSAQVAAASGAEPAGQ